MLPQFASGYVGSTPVGAAVNPFNYGTASGTGLPLDLVPGNLRSALHGELPQDIVDQIAQHAAEFGVSSGMPGSQFAQYKGLRDLGLTSLDRMDKATQSLLPQFLTPYQSGTLALEHQRQAALENQAYQNRVQQMQAGRGGENSAPMLAPITAGPIHGAAGPFTGTGSSGVGDFLARYLSPGRGMAPMGSRTQFSVPNVPGSWASQPVSFGAPTPGFYAGTQGGYDAGNMQDLVDLGIADPSWGIGQGSFTGDISGYDDDYGYG